MVHEGTRSAQGDKEPGSWIITLFSLPLSSHLRGCPLSVLADVSSFSTLKIGEPKTLAQPSFHFRLEPPG